jgi:hypothetical protein
MVVVVGIACGGGVARAAGVGHGSTVAPTTDLVAQLLASDGSLRLGRWSLPVVLGAFVSWSCLVHASAALQWSGPARWCWLLLLLSTDVHVVLVVVVLLRLRAGCTSSALCSPIGLDVPHCIIRCDDCCLTLFYLNTKRAMHNLEKKTLLGKMMCPCR